MCKRDWLGVLRGQVNLNPMSGSQGPSFVQLGVDNRRESCMPPNFSPYGKITPALSLLKTAFRLLMDFPTPFWIITPPPPPENRNFKQLEPFLIHQRALLPGFPYNCLPVSCGDIGFKKILGLVLAWKSGLKVALLPLECSCPLQTILLRGLMRCDSPLQIVMAIQCKFKFKQKGRQTAITICRGLSHPTGRASLPSENISGRFFSRVENPSDDIYNRLFFMNKKGERVNIGHCVPKYTLLIHPPFSCPLHWPL
jgi:hypothetical protein